MRSSPRVSSNSYKCGVCGDQILAPAILWGVRIGRDRRPDVLDREANRARFEWSELRRLAEHVAVQLLLDPDDVAVVLGVHGVAAAAEIDEVEE